MHPGLFLDRDGVVVQSVQRSDGTWGSPRTLSQFFLVDFARNAISKAVGAGFKVIIVTNQPDIARHKLSNSVLESMHSRLRQELPDLTAIYSCVHDNNDQCECRKPKPGLLLCAAAEWEIDLSASWLIGDRAVDMVAANACGVRPICIPTQTRGAPNVRSCGEDAQHQNCDSLQSAIGYLLMQPR